MTLRELRMAIDDVDSRLVALLNERARLALAVGRLKRDRGLPLYDPRREAQVLRRVRARSRALDGPLDAHAITRLFERVIDEARQIEISDLEAREERAGRAGNGRGNGRSGIRGAGRARHREAR